MTKNETLVILAMLSAYYGEGKSDAREMAAAWYALLKDYDFATTQLAVINFAKNDRRDYATFPAPGKIIEAIEGEVNKRRGVYNNALRQTSYENLPEQYKEIISAFDYAKLVLMGEEQLVANKDKIIGRLTPRNVPELEDAYGRTSNGNKNR